MKWLKNILSILARCPLKDHRLSDHLAIIRNRAFIRSLVFVGLMAILFLVILFLTPARVCLGADSNSLSFQGSQDTIHFLTDQKKYQADTAVENYEKNHPIQCQLDHLKAILTTGHTQTHGHRDIGLSQSQLEKDLTHTQYKYAFSYGLFVHHYESKKANEGFENRMMAFERKGLVLSYFDNSYNEDTVFFGYGLHSDKYYSKYSKWWTRGNLYLGGLVGYGDKNPINCHGLGLGVYPTASIGYERYSIEMGVMPTFVWWGLKVEF